MGRLYFFQESSHYRYSWPQRSFDYAIFEIWSWHDSLRIWLIIGWCQHPSQIVISREALRADRAIDINWYLDYDPDVNTMYHIDSELDLVSDFDKRDRSTVSEDRDSCMRPNWPIGPDYCTILTACGPTEIAYYMRVHRSLHGIVTSCCPAGREDCWPTPTTFLCALTLIENHTLVCSCHCVLDINRKDYLNSRSCGIELSF